MLNYFLIILMVCVGISEAFGETTEEWTTAMGRPDTKLGLEVNVMTMKTEDATCALEYPSKVTYTQDLQIGTVTVTTATWCTRDFIRYYSFEPSQHHAMLSGAYITGVQLTVTNTLSGHMYIFDPNY